jgi:putative secretion ATPase (PEP-CTERM system associated)
MYESYFNLKTKPFELLPNPEFLFLSRSHKRAVTYLDYGIRERSGFILLTGEVGSGKTTIVRDLIKKLDDSIVLSKVFNTSVDSSQLLAMVNNDFGIPVQGKDKVVLLRELDEFLIDQYAKGNKPTLIIDEAQNLTPKILEEIRMLSNLETDDTKLLQIILVGQPELRETLALPSLLQLRQRININCHIYPLTRQEVEDYILHRLHVAGNRDAVAFSCQAFDIIHRYSRGIPRLINVICDFLLISAFIEATRQIEEENVLDIVGDLDFENQYWKSKMPETRNLNPVVAKTDQVQSKGDLLSLLQGMTRRLDVIEKDLKEHRQVVIKELADKITSCGNALLVHVEETHSSVCALRKDIETVRSRIEYKPDCASEKTPREGLLRRMLR